MYICTYVNNNSYEYICLLVITDIQTLVHMSVYLYIYVCNSNCLQKVLPFKSFFNKQLPIVI